jgi:hypothetical protein
MHFFNISVLEPLQRYYNFAPHVSIAISSSSGAYNFHSYKLMLRATHTAYFNIH